MFISTGFGDIFKEKLFSSSVSPEKTISPSKMKCKVFEALKLQGLPYDGRFESFEDRGYRETGTFRHQKIQEFIKSYSDKGVLEWLRPEEALDLEALGLEIVSTSEYETRLGKKNSPISLSLDGIIRYKGELYILEIKTTSSFSKGIPLEKHLPQGIAYSALTRIQKVMWVYEKRDDYSIKAVVQSVSEEERGECLQAFTNIIINTHTPFELGRNLSYCNLCFYRETCPKLYKKYKEDKEAEDLF